MNRLTLGLGVAVLLLGTVLWRREISAAEARGAVKEAVAQVQADRAAYLADSASWSLRVGNLQAHISSLSDDLAQQAESTLTLEIARERAEVRADGALAQLRASAETPADSHAVLEVAAALDTAIQASEQCSRTLATCHLLSDSSSAALLLFQTRLEAAETLSSDQATTIDRLEAVSSGGFGLSDLVPWLLATGLAILHLVR